MLIDVIIKKSIKVSEIKIIKLLFQIIEIIICWYYYKISKKNKKVSGKFFKIFQIFSDGKLYTFHRRKKHEILIKSLNKNLEIDNKVLELTNKSYVKLFDINSSDVEKTVKYFYSQKIYNSHVPFNDDFPNKLISVDDFLNTPDYHYGSFDIKTSIKSEVIKKICSMKLIWDTARKYLNSNEVRIYSINTMLTKQSEMKNYVVNMHKDYDSAGSFVIFIYWTEVSKLNGSTKILPGNHLFENDRRVRKHIGEPLVQYLEGKNGSMFAVDTWALHAGNINITSPRLVTWFRFSSMPSKTYYRDNNYLFKKELDEINHDKKH